MSQITTLTNHRSPQNQPHYFIRTHHLNRRPLCWSHQNKGSINQGCHKRFYRHMFFWFIYILPFETSATASCGYMLGDGILPAPVLWGLYNINHEISGSRKKNHQYFMKCKGPRVFVWLWLGWFALERFHKQAMNLFGQRAKRTSLVF